MGKIGKAAVRVGEERSAANLHARFLGTDLHRLTRILRRVENGVSLFGPAERLESPLCYNTLCMFDVHYTMLRVGCQVNFRRVDEWMSK